MTKPTDNPDLDRLPGLGLLWGGIGCFGFVLTAFLIIGVLLPGTWNAERTVTIAAEPTRVYPYLSDLGQWEAWTHWPELKSVEDSLVGQAGVHRSWDDPTYGAGTLTLVEREAPRVVRYEVRVEGGVQIDGIIELTPSSGSTVLRWAEEGTFGRNPILRYTALSLDELQGEEMDKALERLAALVR